MKKNFLLFWLSLEAAYGMCSPCCTCKSIWMWQVYREFYWTHIHEEKSTESDQRTFLCAENRFRGLFIENFIVRTWKNLKAPFTQTIFSPSFHLLCVMVQPWANYVSTAIFRLSCPLSRSVQYCRYKYTRKEKVSPVHTGLKQFESLWCESLCIDSGG